MSLIDLDVTYAAVSVTLKGTELVQLYASKN